MSQSWINTYEEHHWFVWQAPERWYAGICYLVVRLIQTSFMAMIRTQMLQAILVCSFTLLVCVVQREFSPMRRASDNHVALLAQMLIFTWVFIFLLRLYPDGVFENAVAATVVGTLLCIAFVSVCVVAVVLANRDRVNEQRAEQRALSEPAVPDASMMTGDEEDEGAASTVPHADSENTDCPCTPDAARIDEEEDGSRCGLCI